MQSVADLHFLNLAEIVVELSKRWRVILAGSDAAILVETAPTAKFEDIIAQQRKPSRIDACSLVVFVDQALELGSAKQVRQKA